MSQAQSVTASFIADGIVQFTGTGSYDGTSLNGWTTLNNSAANPLFFAPGTQVSFAGNTTGTVQNETATFLSGGGGACDGTQTCSFTVQAGTTYNITVSEIVFSN